MKLLILPLIALSLLAGCLDNASEPPEAEVEEIEGQDLDTTPAEIFGIILDQDAFGLANATVEAQDLGLLAISDRNGSFSFPNIDFEGRIELRAYKEGYLDQFAVVQLVPGLAARITFTLREIQDLSLVAVTYDFHGYLACSSHPVDQDCPQVGDSADHFEVNLRADRDRLTGILVETIWDASALNQGLRQEVYMQGDRPPTLFGSSDNNMGVHRLELYDMEVLEGFQVVDTVISASESAPASLVISQDFQIFVTVFYNEAPPEGFTLLN